MPSSYFALVESALEAGLSPSAHRASLGRLLAPFTQAAAKRPELAWFPTPRTAAEIVDVKETDEWRRERIMFTGASDERAIRARQTHTILDCGYRPSETGP